MAACRTGSSSIQAKANRALTAASIPEIERQIAIIEHASACSSAARRRRSRAAARSTTQNIPPPIPVGMPAQLLERRPDVVQAERLLVAANADVGAAKALFYPNITLTGSLGAVSGDLADFLKGDSLIWSVGASLLQPIFNGKRIRRNYEAAQARFDQALALYQQSALNAYREVADALVRSRSSHRCASSRRRASWPSGTPPSSRAIGTRTGFRRISRSSSPISSCFNWSCSSRSTRGDQLRQIAQLYRALGGGWQPEAAPQAPGPPPPPSSSQPMPPPPPPPVGAVRSPRRSGLRGSGHDATEFLKSRVPALGWMRPTIAPGCARTSSRA